MIRLNLLRAILLPFILFAIFSQSISQEIMPRDSVTGKFLYMTNVEVKLKSEKKIMEAMKVWSSKKIDNLQMVFTVIKSRADSLELKAVTDVPSKKGLHPISFRLLLVAKKRAFTYRASEFFFEDINLTLEGWIEKYGDSQNSRSQQNAELIQKGIDSHVFMSIENLTNEINSKSE